jgi:hypothetical protein
MLSNLRWVSEASQSELHLICCTCLVTSCDHQPNLLHLLSDLLQSAHLATSVFSRFYDTAIMVIIII